MKAEILSTGDELRSGAIMDSNSAYVAQKLEDAAIEVKRHICVGDDIDGIVSELIEIGNCTDIAVVTGGLGPTADDVTALSAAKAAGVELILDNAALASMQNFFSARNLPLSPSNKKQALLPEGAELLPNAVGTAPGFSLNIGSCRFFFVPGVPSEMRHMLTKQVLPRIENHQGNLREYSRVTNIVTFGLTESATDEKLTHFSEKYPDIKLGLRVKFPEIHIKLYARSNDETYLSHSLENASEWIFQKLGDRVVSFDESSMEVVVGDLLRREKATIAVAESCTGGLISHRLTNVPGSSDYFSFSVITYSNDAKITLLGVSPSILEQHGAVHVETAKMMAQGVRQFSGATYGLSTTGIAGPSGGTVEKPVGTVCIGLAGPEVSKSRRYIFSFENRSMNKQIFATTALDVLRRELIKKSN